MFPCNILTSWSFAAFSLMYSNFSFPIVLDFLIRFTSFYSCFSFSCFVSGMSSKAFIRTSFMAIFFSAFCDCSRSFALKPESASLIFSSSSSNKISLGVCYFTSTPAALTSAGIFFCIA